MNQGRLPDKESAEYDAFFDFHEELCKNGCMMGDVYINPFLYWHLNAWHTEVDVIDDYGRIAQKYAEYRDFMYLGRKAHAPVAYEGALKLKEVSYIHAEAYAGGELKHGPIAMLDVNFPVVALVPQDDVYEKMISNIEEVKARSSPIIAIATEGDATIDGYSVRTESQSVKEVIGVVPQEIALYPMLSARENLHFWGQMYGMSGQALRSRVDEVLDHLCWGLERDRSQVDAGILRAARGRG